MPFADASLSPGGERFLTIGTPGQSWKECYVVSKIAAQTLSGERGTILDFSREKKSKR